MQHLAPAVPSPIAGSVLTLSEQDLPLEVQLDFDQHFIGRKVWQQEWGPEAERSSLPRLKLGCINDIITCIPSFPVM